MSGGISIKKAALINAAAKYSTVIMNIFFSAILARILTPEEYGIVAVVTIFTNLFNLLCSFGFGTAVIQRRDLSEVDLHHIFSFTVYLGIALAVLFSLLGFPLTKVYQNTVYQPVCAILSVSVFFNTINMVPNGILLRDKKFKLIGIRMVVSNAICYIAAIGFALLGFKHYSLVLYSALVSLFVFIWNNHSTKLRFKVKINMAPIKSILSYSSFQFAFSLVGYLETNLDKILISTAFGSTPLGFYDKSYRLTKYPVSYLGGVISPVLHPILSEYQDYKQIIYEKYLRLLKLMSSACVFIVPLFFINSREIILLLYGNQWENAIQPFRYLSLAVYPLLLMTTTGAIYQSSNNMKLLFIAGCINAAITTAFLVIGISVGSIESIAACVTIANWLNMCATYIILIKYALNMSVFIFAKEFAIDIIALIILIILQSYLASIMEIKNLLAAITIKSILSIICYGVYLWLTGQLKTALSIVKKKFNLG